jgi:hypothetical protein
VTDAIFTAAFLLLWGNATTTDDDLRNLVMTYATAHALPDGTPDIDSAQALIELEFAFMSLPTHPGSITDNAPQYWDRIWKWIGDNAMQPFTMIPGVFGP